VSDPTTSDNREPDPERTQDGYALRGDEIETMYDDYIMKLKRAVKLLKEQTQSGSPNRMRRMDSDNPLENPEKWDI